MKGLLGALVVGLGLAGGLLLAGATAAEAATVLERRETLRIDADGSTRHDVALRIRLDDASDATRWASFPIALDDNRRLLDVEAWVVEPGGDRRRIRRGEQDVMEASPGVALHSSRSYHLLQPDVLRPGEILDVRYAVEEEPYFPGGLLPLSFAGETIENLDLRLHAAAELPHWRWKLDGAAGHDLEITETADGLRVRGRVEAADDLPALAAGTALSPLLRYAWGPYSTWSDVGRWYAELLDDVPVAGGATRALADELVPSDVVERKVSRQVSRQVLESLLAFVRRQVRYVAVEVGIGGYRPTPPGEVLQRRWGDCKDKSLLLIDLLRHRGVAAHPALVRLDHERRIDHDFPTVYGFNHLIVAVPASGLAADDGDLPISEGFLFVDPTQTVGDAAYLHGGVRGQDALVVLGTVDGGSGRLVPMPPLVDAQTREVDIDLALDEAGDAKGTFVVRRHGDVAADLLRLGRSTGDSELRSRFRRAFEGLLPATRITEISWGGEETPGPRFEVLARGEIRGFADGVGPRRRLRLPDLTLTPDPAAVDELIAWSGERDAGAGPVGRVEAGRLESRMTLRLPPGACPPRERSQRTENDVGAFELEITAAPSDGDTAPTVEVRRTVVLHRSWIGETHLAELRELSLAEHRAQRRRVRLRCE